MPTHKQKKLFPVRVYGVVAVCQEIKKRKTYLVNWHEKVRFKTKKEYF